MAGNYNDNRITGTGVATVNGTVYPGRSYKPQDGELLAIKMAASQAVVKGDFIFIKQSDGLGYLAPAAAAGYMFAGIAYESMTTVAGDYLRVQATGVVEVLGTAQYAGVLAYHLGANDNTGTSQTITTTAGDGTNHYALIGTVVVANSDDTFGTTATTCRVKLRTFESASA